MLTVCTWWWGNKFSADDVRRLAAGVCRHLTTPHRFMVITDRVGVHGFVDELHGSKVDRAWLIGPVDYPLTQIKGCFARLRMFDPEWQQARGIARGDRLVCVDLDTIITGPLDPLFERPEPFVIMQGGNAANPCPFNGALMMLRGGAHPEVWRDFSITAAMAIPHYAFPDDQGWLAHKVPGAAGWKTGPAHGVYVFQKPGWVGGKSETRLPEGARLVTFINRGPAELQHLDWVQRNWAA